MEADLVTVDGLSGSLQNPVDLELSTYGNASLSDEEIQRLILANPQLLRPPSSNFDPITQAILIVLFGSLIAFGTAGNGLVCYVVIVNAHMRTPRNLLILNLASSDLILCLFTQPFNLLKVSMPAWKLGKVMCKLVPMAAGTNVFVSTLSITAIALDRFHLIVHPTDKDPLLVKSCMALVIVCIWLLAILLAAPLLVFSITRAVEPVAALRLYEVCVEDPDLHVVKAAYSVVSAFLQYLAPIVIVSVAHAQICNKLRSRMPSQPIVHTVASTPREAAASTSPVQLVVDAPVAVTASPYLERKRRKDALRKRKTNRLLVAIAVVFAGSWLPLNVFNIIADFDHAWVLAVDGSGLIIAVCHLVALGSACANPVLYGWLNDNFQHEFVAVLCRRWCPGAAGRCDGDSHADDDRDAVGVALTIVTF